MSNPSPFMIQLCQRLFQSQHIKHSDEEEILTEICTNWSIHAFDHCAKVLTFKPTCTKLCCRIFNLKKLIFQESEASLMSDQTPMPVHPELLSSSQCQELAGNVIKDYIHHIPQYLSVTKENHVLREILVDIVYWAIIALFLFFTRRWLLMRKCSVILKKSQASETEAVLPLKVKNFYRRNINSVLYETKYLTVIPAVNPILLNIGYPVVGLRINRSQFVNIEKIFAGPAMKSYNSPADADISFTQASKQLQRFFQKTDKHLLIISLEFDEIEEDTLEPRKSPQTSFIPIHKPEKKIGIRRRP